MHCCLFWVIRSFALFKITLWTSVVRLFILKKLVSNKWPLFKDKGSTVLYISLRVKWAVPAPV